MKRIYISFLFACLTLTAVAQQSITVNSSKGEQETIDLPEGMQSSMDSLYKSWLAKRYIKASKDCGDFDTAPVVSEEVYRERLKRIPAVIEMPYNSVVRGFIDAYANRLRNKVAFMLTAGNLYMPMIEEALDLYNLPNELKYLPVIESAMNPTATSRQGAVGLWQFMLRTGQSYGLENNSLMDERRDPFKSSRAAARYLKDLYGIYNDWHLVLAAYNCGPGTVNKAIKRAGGKTDYWEIYSYLPRETRGYVPAFIAANYIMTYYCEHHITPMEMDQYPEGTDTVHVHKNIHFNQVVEACKDINIELLRALNPELKRDVIPGNAGAYALRLPKSLIDQYIDNEDSIVSSDSDAYIGRREIVEIDEAPIESSKSTKKNTRAAGKKSHKVRAGETLSSIAKKHGTTVAKLKRLNGIKGNTIQKGKTLRVK